MPHDVKKPTYHRLMSAFKAVGPYLREEKSESGLFFFDCLSVCVNDQKAPEKREFWGWWAVITEVDESTYRASYYYGRYDVEGHWIEESLTSSNKEEVERTREVFHQKLSAMLNKNFSLNLEQHEPNLVLS